MENILILALLGLPVTASCAADTNAVQLTPAFINKLVEELRTNHPALRAVESRVLAASLNTNSVRLWDDPMFKFGGFTASQHGPILSEEGDLAYGLDQKLPLFGKAQAARRVAQAEAGSEAARLAYQFQILRRDLTKALFKTALADRAVEIAACDLVWLDTMAAAANRGTFNEVMEARSTLLVAQLMHARAVSEQYQLLADLGLLCGVGDFAELQAITARDASILPPVSKP